MSVDLEKRSVVIESTSLRTVTSRKLALHEECSDVNLMVLWKELMWLVKVMRLPSSLVQMKNTSLMYLHQTQGRATRCRCQHVLFEIRHEKASTGWSHACA